MLRRNSAARTLAAVALVALAGLTAACHGSYYRLPLTAAADGSVSNDVVYAYFTIGSVRPYWTPLRYTEFDPDADESVTFVLHVTKLSAPSAIRGVLHRPDGSVHKEFSRAVAGTAPGIYGTFSLTEEFPMSALRPWQGRWRLDLFRDGEPLGQYRFVLADAATIGRFRGTIGPR